MASAVIHMAIANEINKKIKRDSNKILIGSIAPDISKYINQSKVGSHFLDIETNDIPNIDKFLAKYEDKLNDDFVMGYFIHLYTDFLWFKYFIPEIYEKNILKKLDGTNIKCIGNTLDSYIYNDYDNLNTKLLDEYNMDLHIFYNEPPKLEHIIDEIPMENIKLIIDKISIIIETSKVNKDIVFDIENIKKFITISTNLILAKLTELKVM